MRVRESTKPEQSNQLRIVRRNLPGNMARYEHLDADVAKRRSSEQLDRLLANQDANKFFTARERGEVVGYLWLIADGDDIFIAYLYVLSRHRRHGYGERLVRWAETYAAKRGARRLALHVFAANTTAVRLYEKCGFTQSNVRMLKPL